MEPGDKVKVKKSIRSQKIGMLLPREGTIVRTMENLGRILLLVDFGQGSQEFLFEHDVEDNAGLERPL